jgi:hypothetical protein
VHAPRVHDNSVHLQHNNGMLGAHGPHSDGGDRMLSGRLVSRFGSTRRLPTKRREPTLAYCVGTEQLLDDVDRRHSVLRLATLYVELAGVGRLESRTFDLVAAREGLHFAALGLLVAELDRAESALTADRACSRVGLAHRPTVHPARDLVRLRKVKVPGNEFDAVEGDCVKAGGGDKIRHELVVRPELNFVPLLVIWLAAI